MNQKLKSFIDPIAKKLNLLWISFIVYPIILFSVLNILSKTWGSASLENKNTFVFAMYVVTIISLFASFLLPKLLLSTNHIKTFFGDIQDFDDLDVVFNEPGPAQQSDVSELSLEDAKYVGFIHKYFGHLLIISSTPVTLYIYGFVMAFTTQNIFHFYPGLVIGICALLVLKPNFENLFIKVQQITSIEE